MTFKFNTDRGTILRITFDVVYPSGQMKTVSMNMADYDEFKDIVAIALNEEGVKSIVAPAISAMKDSKAAQNAIDVYDTLEKDGHVKPGILIVHKDGSVTPKCGAHHSSGHIEKGNAVNRFM